MALKTTIPLHTLTQASLNKLTRAFPRAKQSIRYPSTGKLIHLLTLEFTPREKRLIEAAARDCGVGSLTFVMNTILGSAENTVEGLRRAR